MHGYCYSPLSQRDSIRLLRLLPKETDPTNLRCELFEYPLHNTDRLSHLYEAVSYVWGSTNDLQSIIVDNCSLEITKNLYKLLLRLRDDSLPRIIWVDAICINQDKDNKDNKEKEGQIRLMAEIYARASRVIVWLGDAGDKSSLALDTIQLAGKKSTAPLDLKLSKQAILQLLKESWFRRIWVLQEVAAARNVLIMYGSTEIDGHAFCLGLDSLNTDVEESMIQATFLIREAIFRPRKIPRNRKRYSLDICSLGELLDMYHTYEATRSHDKIYALLGMCSHEQIELLNGAGLEPDYAVKWEILLQRLVKFLLGNRVSVNTWETEQMVVIKSRGCILGRVSKGKPNSDMGGRQTLEVIFENTSNELEFVRNSSASWILPISAKPIQEGDLLCLLQDVSKPMIVRIREDYFTIIMIATIPPEHWQTWDGKVNWSELRKSAPFNRDFLLVWDWKVPSEEPQYPGEYDSFMQTNNLRLDVETGLEGQLSSATRRWNVALILGDLGRYEEAEEKLQQAVEGYENVIWKEHRHTLESWYGLTPLGWAAGSGCGAVVDLLLTKDDVDIDLKDSQCHRTPLSWAAENGHRGIVKQLLDTGEADVNSRDKHGQTPLSWAAENGHDSIVELLLAAGRADVDAKDKYDRTPLLYAAVNGHEAVVKLLLQTAKVDVNAKDTYDQTPLSYAAWYGYDAIVRLLRKNQANIDSINNKNDQAPLAFAARYGHKSVVKQLLATGKVNVESEDGLGRTPLSLAAAGGHEAVVKQLLATGKVNVESKDRRGRTPLSLAAAGGHEAVVKQLLATGKVDVESKDYKDQTPLSWAAERGHEAVVKQLLATGKVNVESRDRRGRTPLSFATKGGHEAVVKLL